MADAAKFRGAGNFPIPAYSEFMPPPRLGIAPYDNGLSRGFFEDEDPWGWPVSEYEQEFELRPGLQNIAHQAVGALIRLGRGEPAHGIARNKLAGNPFWPEDLSSRAGSLLHERYILLLPLALSRTQDDKGRVRWTLFGGSEQGPEKAFWKSFYREPDRESEQGDALPFFRRLIEEAYGVKAEVRDLHAVGFRVYSAGNGWNAATFGASPRPRWTGPFLWNGGDSLRGVRYLLCFEPFSELPTDVRRAYLAGEIHLLPFPGSLLFWGTASYLTLRRELPLAMQIPLLHLIARHEEPRGMRVPQSGWMHEPKPDLPEPHHHHGPLRNTYKRTHRWARVRRDEDETALPVREDRIAHVLFSTAPQDLDLYGKPMARNVQIWTEGYRLLLDGPCASQKEIGNAMKELAGGGLFGYRFQFPAMRVGRHEIYWHRPVVACLAHGSEDAVVLDDAPLGYLTCYSAEKPDPGDPVELWPRILQRDAHVAAARISGHAAEKHFRQTSRNVRKILDAQTLLGRRLPSGFARSLISAPKPLTFEEWLAMLPERTGDTRYGRELAREIRRRVDFSSGKSLPTALTFRHSARREFEVRYWQTIRFLAEGRFINKCNADCIPDEATQNLLRHHHRDLEALGDYLLEHYRRVFVSSKMKGKALAGEIPFRWETDFAYDWYGGWSKNRDGTAAERNLVAVIPGRNRGEAVIMADHYDTAYMEDFYYKERGGQGARLAAAGADDNHSATAALMLAAPVFCRLSREGRLGCDVWLVHLTGEEFPSDCLGARNLARQLVEGTLGLCLPDGARADLSHTRVRGVYVLDMVAHNNDHNRDIFQMAPGTGAGSMLLAYHAQTACEIWNRSAVAWNRRPPRRGRRRGCRTDGRRIPAVAPHPQLLGEVRPHYDPSSTLYNTDGQIFSDAGVPVVLFMEDYDINRTGYHDSHDTMANIDLDYGAAVAAIAIEAVARAAAPEKANPRGDAWPRATHRK